MKPTPFNDELLGLAYDLAEGCLTPPQTARLEELLLSDEANRQKYVNFMLMVSALHRTKGEGQMLEAGETFAEDSKPQVARSLHNMPLEFIGDAWHGTMAFAENHPWKFSYIAAGVLFLLVGLVAQHVYVTYQSAPTFAEGTLRETQSNFEKQFATDHGKQKADDGSELKAVFVARIAGRDACQWQDAKTSPKTDQIAQGDRFALKSGLLEIVYDTGARVILEGPCTYTADSATGGFLAVGKLTAKMEKKSSGNSEISKVPNTETSQSSAFTVRTPTALVTDLGTEFGVEVDEAGLTQSRVFQGKIVFVAFYDGKPTDKEVTLIENQSARTSASIKEKPRVVVLQEEGEIAEPVKFVRWEEFAARVKANQASRLTLFRKWQAFSDDLKKRDDLLAYYDFQKGPDSNRDKDNYELLRNRAKTGARFDGRIMGATAWVPGRISGKQALKFGNSVSDGVRVNIPVPCKQMTLAAWVNIESAPTKYAGLVMSFDEWGPKTYFHWQMNSHQMIFSGPDTKTNHFSSPIFSNDRCGQWCFVSVAIDCVRNVRTFYYNGVPVGSFSARPATEISIGRATIGAWERQVHKDPDVFATTSLFSGSMDELMIFNAALNGEEIRRIYDASVIASANK